MTHNIPTSSRSHRNAVLLALFVTFLWSTSWVLIKIGLKSSLPPVTFAGLRYTLAFLCLLPFVLLNSTHRKMIRNLSKTNWWQLALLGLIFYSITQGAQFIGLAFLPAATVTLLLNFSPILVALSSGNMNKEATTLAQWGGIILSVLGAIIYFLPLNIPAGQSIGLLAVIIGVLANASSSLLGRTLNTQEGLPAILITTISMGIGGVLLLLVGAFVQGFGKLALQQWLIIAWLAVVNTAIAFTLWNKSLQTLTAVESSIINGSMLPQIAILAWLLLDEPLNLRQTLGLGLVSVGILIVQVWRGKLNQIRDGTIEQSK
ncbi:MAG: EamA family transporter [Anaerolineaceae bacterium]|nr:EamA family transporter [Anaerolineaceae bacterium]